MVMTKIYKLVAVSDSAKEIKGGQTGGFAHDVRLWMDKPTHIGRAGGPDDFKIPAEMVQYSSKHCKLEYSAEREHWIITDSSTNGTYIRPPKAKDYSRIPKSKPTKILEGSFVRLSAPPAAKKRPLEYILESVDEEATSPTGEATTKSNSNVKNKGITPGNAAAAKAAAAAGNETGGSNKRARTSLEGKFEAEAKVMAEADHISEMMVLRENNEALRKNLLAEQESKAALEEKLQKEIDAAAKVKAYFEKVIEELEVKADKASEEQKSALDRLEVKAAALEEAVAEKEEYKSTATAAESKAAELESELAEKTKQVEEARTEIDELKASFETLSDVLAEEKRRSTEAEAACARAEAILREKEASQAATRVELEQVGGNKEQLEARCAAAVKEAADLHSLLQQKTEEVRFQKIKVDELRLSESSAKERERMMRAVLKEMAGLADEAASAVEKGARQMAEQEKAAAEIKKQIQLRSQQAEKISGRPLLGSLRDSLGVGTSGGAGPSNAAAGAGAAVSPLFLGQTQALTYEVEEEAAEEEQQEEAAAAAAGVTIPATTTPAAAGVEEEEEEDQCDDVPKENQGHTGPSRLQARLAAAETQPSGFFTIPGAATVVAVEEEEEEEAEAVAGEERVHAAEAEAAPDLRVTGAGEGVEDPDAPAPAALAVAAEEVIDLMDEDEEENEDGNKNEGGDDDNEEVVVIGSDADEEGEEEGGNDDDAEDDDEGGDNDDEELEERRQEEEEDEDMDDY